ncbi:hypothetical protein IEQ34_006726 [Dendrobium chrysotoxum]|uniref:Uncharacterized protein n=1 Tax=Dendrobium chrysotoxum TaxID=161865 RepID=A0AAV7H907_DENCH|nr:hypothetical protein IEQ34_006726 [Dendrobium chrysotoxum]
MDNALYGTILVSKFKTLSLVSYRKQYYFPMRSSSSLFFRRKLRAGNGRRRRWKRRVKARPNTDMDHHRRLHRNYLHLPFLRVIPSSPCQAIHAKEPKTP